jgi:ABC-type branched-subunit amino acid transport system substrate-binding protein
MSGFLNLKATIAVSLAMVASSLACSRLVDSSPNQCFIDNDCVGRAPPGTRAVCSADYLCVAGPQCSTHADCLARDPATPSLCRKSDFKCAPLATDECSYKAEPADLTNENTLWFGMISPRTSGPHMEAATELVRQHIVRSGNLPAATVLGQRRPMAFVSCTNDRGGYARSIDHLMNVVKVPAIVGSNDSGDVVAMLTTHDTPKEGVLAISPTASAPGISDIKNDGLFFRLSGINTVAVKSLAHVLRQVVEPQLRAGPRPVLAPGEQMKVAVMHKSDAVGLSDAGSAASMVFFNGKPAAANGSNFRVVDYGHPGDPSNTMPAARYAAAVADVLAFKPHAIFVFGSLEFSAMDKEIETRWAEPAYRPTWLVVKGIVTVFTNDIGSNEDWARRVYGAQPLVDKSTTAYRSFEQSFKANFPSLMVGATATPSYFDATYLLAYAVAASGPLPITGRNLADAIRARLMPLMPGPPLRQYSVGYDSVFGVLTALSNGERIDLQGLTGSLDFLDNGDIAQTQEIFCMQTEPGPNGSFGRVIGAKASGLIFDPVTETVTGTIAGCPGP